MLETMAISRSDEDTKWVPVSRAAKVLKVSRQRVYQLIGDGALSARKVDRTWLVSGRSIAARVALLQFEGGE